MARVRLIGDKAMNTIISHQDGVRDAVHDEAEEMGNKAEVLLAGHRRTGAASIEVEQGAVDSYVTLDDEAAMHIEFGHWYTNGYGEPQYVPGLYIITRASGLA